MVSIVIPFYERLEHLKCCLDSLCSCSPDFDEVVVTDDGSSEQTVHRLKDMIHRYAFPIRHIWQPRQGFRVAAARNNGIRRARGDYLIFIDSDLMVLPGAIKAHSTLAKQGRFVAGHCKYLTEEQSARVLESSISPSLLEALYGGSPDREIMKQHRRFIKRTLLIRLRLASPKKQSLGGHFSVHRRDVEYVNGYDENFVGWGGEDEDLGIRFIKAGIFGRSAIRYARALHVWHPKELGDMHWTKGANMEYFENENRPFFCENGLIKAKASGTDKRSIG